MRIKLQNHYSIEDETSTGKGKFKKTPGLDEIFKIYIYIYMKEKKIWRTQGNVVMDVGKTRVVSKDRNNGEGDWILLV